MGEGSSGIIVSSHTSLSMTVSTTSSTCQRSCIVTTGGENKFLLGAVQGLLEELLSLLGIRHDCKSNYRFDWQGHRRFYKGCAVERDVRGKLQLATFFISVGVVLTCLLVLLVRLPSKLLGLPNVLVWTPQKSVYLLNRVRLGHRVFLTFRIGLGHGIQLDGWVSVWCLFLTTGASSLFSSSSSSSLSSSLSELS